jgi:MATE family multidrug resistance protein
MDTHTVQFTDRQGRLTAHLRIFTLAAPMILANITTPLLGLVDTAVMGHMDSSAHLAGASIGALILTQIYWVSGFLRMSTTGLSAQAKGMDQSAIEAAKVFYQTGVIALCIGLILWILQQPILQLGLWLTQPAPEVSLYTREYFSVRVWGAPAALLNLVFIGWLVGQQLMRSVLIIQVVGNLINGALDIGFVFGLGWGVTGVATASVIAEYSMAIFASVVAFKHIRGVLPSRTWFNSAARKLLLQLNGNMLLRNLALQGCLAFLTIQGARYGQTATAVNAILMQFFVLIALGLDGIAYAIEALVGEAAGAKKLALVRVHTHRGLMWSSAFAILYSVIFYFGGEDIIALLTDIPALQMAALPYLPLMIGLPLLAHWCFLYDGVFVGLTRASVMRDTMILSAALVFFPVWWLLKSQGNEALWIALLAFLLARGLTLGGMFYWLNKRRTLVNA